jgi:hypothetical protein
VDAGIKKRLSVSKRAEETFNMERFNLMKLNDVEVKEHCQVKIYNTFAALENFDDVDISRVWNSITESIESSASGSRSL